MLIDLRQLAGGEEFDADVCVVGAGAAGISIARELGATGHSVLLAESGGMQYELPTQALYSGAETGTLLSPKTQYLGTSRLRYLGGTTGHWNGWCRRLDPDDFSLRPWVDEVGWPISRDDLEPFYERAAPIVQISAFDYDEETAGVGPKLLPGDEVFETSYFHLSPPTRFGTVYQDELERSDSIRVLLYANVRVIDLDEQASHVSGLEVVRLDGVSFPIRARHFVLATGAIENARLLLANTDVQPNGIGNDWDQVGRYFMDHPFLEMGYMALPYWRHLLPRNYAKAYVKSRGNSIHGILRVRAAVQSRERLLNALIIFRPLPNATRRPLATAVAKFTAGQHALRGEALAKPGSTYYGRVMVHGEQTPNPESRVHLADEVDGLGMRKTRLDWRLRDRDARSLVETAKLFARRLGLHGHGRMRFTAKEHDLWPRADWSWHHIGTTRMHDDPRRGVVNADCRLHGIDNLFVAGSSVFTTAGASNPTFTIVALALRLSDHLKKLLA
ncbi:MAG: GMC family oxidoreductase [Acidobacteria bacterium]|nr:GMC family oxidoreductase [Acidobacteriota bacterium]